MYLSICVSMYLMYLCIWLPTYLYGDLSLDPSVYLSIYLSIDLSIYRSMYRCVWTTMQLLIYWRTCATHGRQPELATSRTAITTCGAKLEGVSYICHYYRCVRERCRNKGMPCQRSVFRWFRVWFRYVYGRALAATRNKKIGRFIVRGCPCSQPLTKIMSHFR